MVGQIRKPLLKEYQKQGGYLLLGYINKYFIEKIIDIITRYFQEPKDFPKDGNIFSIEELFNLFGHKINGLFNEKSDIKIYGCMPIELYENKSIFINYGEQIPNTNFKQNFKEGSYFLNNFDGLIPLKELLS